MKERIICCKQRIALPGKLTSNAIQGVLEPMITSSAPSVSKVGFGFPPEL
jgi:hypothetical protein